MTTEMTTTVLMYYSNTSTRATSDTACLVSGRIESGRWRLQDSFFLGLGWKGVFNELFNVAEECKTPNWDGQGAASVMEETYRLAFRFLEAFPLGVPAPSVGAEPDGHLTLEWYRSPRRTLSVSVDPEGDLHYAALLGPSKTYGTEPFFGDVPKAIMDLVSRVMTA
jgi:hypothetical protein